MDRRTFLAAIGCGMPSLAGCGGRPSTPDATERGATGTPSATRVPAVTPTPDTSGVSFELPWQRLPGPQSGPVNDIQVSGADADRIYAVTATSGHMFSSDGGDSWRQGSEADHHGREIFASPHDPLVAYSQSNRTDDGGKTWYRHHDGRERLRLPGNPEQEEVTDIAWDPFDPETLFVATARAIYRSSDGGRTWTSLEIPGREPPDEVFRVVTHQTREGRLLAGYPDGEIYRSDDRGDRWRAVEGQQAVDGTPMFLAFADDETGGIYVGTGRGDVLHLADGDLTRYTEDLSLDAIRGNTSDPVSADGERLYFLGRRREATDMWTLFRVEASTGSINRVETPAPPVSVTSHPDVAETVYLGGMSWVYESRDGGVTWTRKADGFVERYVVTVGVNPDQPGTLLTGTVCQGGLFVSTDHGSTFSWKRSGIPPFHPDGAWGEHYVMDIAAGGERAYATTSSGLLISEDNGRTWDLLETEFSGSGDVEHGPEHDQDRETYDHLHGLGIDPADPQTVYVGTGRGGIGPAPDSFEHAKMWKSRDGGRSWRDMTSGFPSDLDTIVQEFLVSRHDANRVYVGTKEGHVGMEGDELGDAAGMFQSENAGERWTQLSTPFDNVHALAEGSASSGRLFAATRQGLYRSEDGGDTWRSVLPYPSKGLLCHPDASEVVFVGARTDDDYWDLLVSVDGGDTWGYADLTIQIGLGPDERAYDGIYRHAHYRADKGQITALALERQTSRLYAAVRGSGLWQGDVRQVVEQAR